VRISSLNNAEKDGSTLRFRAKKDSKLWQVEVVDIRNNEVVHEIPTERAFEVANRIQGLYGILMDEKWMKKGKVVLTWSCQAFRPAFLKSRL